MSPLFCWVNIQYNLGNAVTLIQGAFFPAIWWIILNPGHHENWKKSYMVMISTHILNSLAKQALGFLFWITSAVKIKDDLQSVHQTHFYETKFYRDLNYFNCFLVNLEIDLWHVFQNMHSIKKVKKMNSYIEI